MLNSKILSLVFQNKREMQVTVKGVSMQPTLYDGDIITVKKCEYYNEGDVLLFVYKSGELLVHRLVRKEKRYFCKGDNSFRLEDIDESQIFGKVVMVNERNLPPISKREIDLSFRVGRIFKQNQYDKIKTKNHKCYEEYMRVMRTRIS